ncbi:hypothetical protein JVT61DRAFT_10962 [Boletus reticuloceps]|uniref:Fungal-type protein kinase domain-containing protein n=1 Tax=Boletus reticuloceps TaxID=495285 RepID=A0A8I3A5R8_9AGAM|nr:hypothetical protein JVT61DRAFT_10962 [Boletus reticuloceps]
MPSGPVTNWNYDHRSFFPDVSLPSRFIQSPEDPKQAVRRIFEESKSDKLYVNGHWVMSSKPISTEVDIAQFFNSVLRVASGTEGAVMYPWRSHHTIETEDKRKPDIVLTLPVYETVPDLPSSAILAYCEIKTSDQKHALTHAQRQVAEMAGLVTSAMLGRRFCVGMSLCGKDLSLGIFVRGCSIFTRPFNIDE